MLEPWRSRYLAAMGVVDYVARTSLPGAAPSYPIAWDESAIVVDEVKRPPVRESVAKPGVQVSRPVVTPQLPDIPPPPPPPPRKQAHAPVAVPAKERSLPESASVVLLIAALRPGLLLLDAVATVGAPHKQLLANIARSVGTTVSGEELFRWPCADHPQLQRHEGAAREAVVGCLMRRLDAASPHDLLLLGDTPHWVNTEALSLLGSSVRRAVAAPALTEMLHSSSAKREFWKILSALSAG